MEPQMVHSWVGLRSLIRVAVLPGVSPPQAAIAGQFALRIIPASAQFTTPGPARQPIAGKP
jgi:hypothetical protein